MSVLSCHSLLVGDLVFGHPEAIGNLLAHADCPERYMGIVVALTPMLTHQLDWPAPTILYESGVYERFTCQFFFALHDLSHFNVVELAGYQMRGEVHLLYDYDNGVFDRAFCPTIRETAWSLMKEGGATLPLP